MLAAEKIKARFKTYEKFKIFQVERGSHEKILIYDDISTYIGSYNLLSYDGGEKMNYEGMSYRYEGGVVINNKEFALEVKSKFFG